MSDPEQLIAVEQMDRDAAARFYRRYLHREGEVLVADHMQAGKIDESPLIQSYARHRIAAEQAQRERDARIAEDRHEHWSMPHPDDAANGQVCDDISACRDIAAAIRKAGDA